MTIAMQPIYTQTVGGTSVGTINFNSIPQTFTDLKVVASTRCDGAVDRLLGAIRFNGDASSVYSDTYVEGTGSIAASGRHQTNFAYSLETAGTSATSQTFGSSEIYIPNYSTSNFKSFISDNVAENNATAGRLVLLAGLWRSTSSITSITLFPGSGFNFVANSTFTLYGITKG
jgi:hypothetical protein